MILFDGKRIKLRKRMLKVDFKVSTMKHFKITFVRVINKYLRKQFVYVKSVI